MNITKRNFEKKHKIYPGGPNAFPFTFWTNIKQFFGNVSHIFFLRNKSKGLLALLRLLDTTSKIELGLSI